MRTLRKFVPAFALVLLLSAVPARAQHWVPLGPFGGDARSVAYDPHHAGRVFLGTSAGQLYRSVDDGATWTRCADFADDGLVLDNIALDPRTPDTLYVAAWRLKGGGEIFRSRDGGVSWTALAGMHGESVRALAVAAAQPRILVAGALDGVFRSGDGGDTWERISPEGHPELKNIESMAIDPYHPEVIYAGTWHLPWKTSDGGRTWQAIKQGVVDDSDVFSIIVDRTRPTVIYASACTGIYRSDSAGNRFRKVQGIPKSAQRTRSLEQDPAAPEVVYAGTTEGLWKTEDGGAHWQRRTAANLVVNDIAVDPRNSARVLLATDRAGVLASDDGGRTFAPSNRGFAHRQVTAALVDRKDPGTIYVSVINDKDFGGVFVSHDAGVHWTQLNAGLAGTDVFSLQQAANGVLLAGTGRGVFALAGSQWRPLSVSGAKGGTLSGRVAQLAVLRDRWLAATDAGLFTTFDGGRSWRGAPLAGEANLVAMAVSGGRLLAAGPRTLFISRDRGVTWAIASVPEYVASIYTVAVAQEGQMWIATDQGAFASEDGRAWEHVIAGVPARNLRAVAYDDEGRRLLAAAMTSGEIFESRDRGRTWARLADAGWPVRSLIVSRGRLLAATPFSGIVAPADHAQAVGGPARDIPGKQ